MNKFNITPEFAEELGAYLEGKLSPFDNTYIEQLLKEDITLSSFVDELCTLELNDLPDEIPNINSEFTLPEIVDDTHYLGIVTIDSLATDTSVNTDICTIILDDVANVDDYNVDISDANIDACANFSNDVSVSMENTFNIFDENVIF